MWWIDATAGASGDMLLGALLDLDPSGLDTAQEAVDTVLGRLGTDRVHLDTSIVSRCGQRATLASVTCDEQVPGRTWADIEPALRGFPAAQTVFAALAEAEAYVHDIPIDRVHFHEVGALDAIADIVAVTTLWSATEPGTVVVSPVCVGAGTVATDHGRLSVPVPAVTHLLRGVPTFSGTALHEACTPTGAALLQFLATGWGYQPPMIVIDAGIGAGGRDLPDQPNTLRILHGTQPGAATEELVMVETTVDDLDPRAYPEVLTATRNRGALETWLTPVIMKHGRPAVTISALCRPADAASVADALFRNTPTLGVRHTAMRREALDRDFVEVSVHGHTIRVKRGWLRGEIVTLQPEYRDAATAAQDAGVPVRNVIDQARTLAAGSPEG
jgi:hypothetical protein